ncbi:hypothetical protein BD410DRAFT_902582 [Rickenella mellea]|uniref:MYND-type domain-containing protein n=1 Tax=Rickenella mellea TaxID=50990 RepID=A0A4Y7PIY9_9AGAM|nr:hypothetical protein BD410DRAFT_902582 [Rickenella mellea]
MSSQDAPSNGCAVCQTPSTTRCSRCSNVYYCSREHQTQDWKAHKLKCQDPSKGFIAPKKPGTRFAVDAILFPAEATQPMLVQVQHEVKQDDDDGGIFHHALTENFLGDVSRDRRWIPLTDGGIEVLFRDNFANDGSPPNQCIKEITGGNPAWDWAGNVVAIKTPVNRDFVTNISMELDLPVLVKYFMNYGRYSTE